MQIQTSNGEAYFQHHGDGPGKPCITDVQGFIAAVTHDLRAPMHGLIGELELWREDPAFPPALCETRDRMFDAVIYLHQLIKDISDFSLIGLGHLQLHATPTSPRTVMVDTVALLQSKARARSVTVSMRLGPGLPDTLLVDHVRLRQILFNLLGNAIKFSSGRRACKGQVLIDVDLCASPSPTLELIVADNGIGLSENALEKVFKPFEQADTSIQATYGGTGLGLAITKYLVDLMGGSIAVSSQLGQGSRFTVRLPVCLVEESAVARPTVRPGPSPRTPVSLTPPEPTSLGLASQRARYELALIIDDDEFSRKTTEHQLATLQVGADQACDGETALLLWRIRRHAIVFIDLQMPGMDGLSVTRQIRAEENGSARTLIIALTGSNDAKTQEDAAKAGVDVHVTKPMALGALARLLQHPAEQRHLEEA
jgi:CheY-like chemotaxis protein